MKFTAVAASAITVSLVLADRHAHRHQHRHAHAVERDVTVTTNIPGPTAYAFVLNGHEISLEEACAGITNKKLKFADGATPSGLCASSTTKSTTSSTAATTPSTTSSAPPPPASSPAGAFFQSNAKTGASGVDLDFPDGQLSCDTFPSQYGAVPLTYLGLGGWSGLQAVSIVGQFVQDIVTGIPGQSCVEGMMCSYACPPGYQKSQWPSTQGATGQSVGGISCSGGKLHLTNPGLSTKLCIPGSGGVQATNKASGVVAICRTDYPGTESETIPIELQPGQTDEVTCPNKETYYKWQGSGTSAQYYLNPIGTPASQGCQWGSPGGLIGNYAPINLGVGQADGKIWLSIFQNAPTQLAPYSGTVELVGPGLSDTCKYTNGQYCSSTGCNSNGCTVSVISGTATYVISD